jgi:hypothetical protein
MFTVIFGGSQPECADPPKALFLQIAKCLVANYSCSIVGSDGQIELSFIVLVIYHYDLTISAAAWHRSMYTFITNQYRARERIIKEIFNWLASEALAAIRHSSQESPCWQSAAMRKV